MMHIPDPIKTFFDWIAGGLSLAAAVQLVHVLLAIPAAAYMCCRTYEWFEKRRKQKHEKFLGTSDGPPDTGGR